MVQQRQGNQGLDSLEQTTQNCQVLTEGDWSRKGWRKERIGQYHFQRWDSCSSSSRDHSLFANPFCTFLVVVTRHFEESYLTYPLTQKKCKSICSQVRLQGMHCMDSICGSLRVRIVALLFGQLIPGNTGLASAVTELGCYCCHCTQYIWLDLLGWLLPILHTMGKHPMAPFPSSWWRPLACLLGTFLLPLRSEVHQDMTPLMHV